MHKQSQEIETTIDCANERDGFLNEESIQRANKTICKKCGIKEIRFSKRQLSNYARQLKKHSWYTQPVIPTKERRQRSDHE